MDTGRRDAASPSGHRRGDDPRALARRRPGPAWPRRLARWTSARIVVLLLLSLAAARGAMARPAQELFHDDFGTPGASAWSTSGGSWSRGDGVYLQTDVTSEAYSWVRDRRYADHAVVTRLMLPSSPQGGGERCVGVVARMADTDNLYLADVCAGHREVRLWRRLRGSWAPLGIAPAAAEADTWYELRLEAVESSLTVSLDGASVITAQDDAHAGGIAGLRTSQARAAFDTFTVLEVVAPTPFPSPTRAADRLLYDGFETALGERWTAIGTWATRGGMLHQDLAGNYSDVMAWREGIYCRDCVVTTRARLDTAGGGELGVIARVRGRSDLYLFDLRRQSQQARIWRRLDGQWSQLAAVPFAVETGRWYELSLEATGSELRGAVDGRPVIEARDDSLAWGMAGLRTGDATASYDWIAVTGPPVDVQATPTPLPETARHPDLDALYIERSPRFAWNEEKNWPDVGDVVRFHLYIANKGQHPAGPFTVRWETLEPAGSTVEGSVVERACPGLAPGAKLAVAYDRAGVPAAWGDGRWRDGAYRIQATVDSHDAVDEGPFEGNNDLADFTNALSFGFKVSSDVYKTIDGLRTGLVEDVPPGNRNDAGFFWFSRPAETPPYRAGTYSWEDWAQRQVMQMNEYFHLAEDRFFGGERNRLIRVRLDHVEVVEEWPDGLHWNFPFAADDVGWSLDAAWGFKDFSPIYTVLPQCLVLEKSLLHEIGHHLGRHHVDLGAGQILLDGGLLAAYPGDRRCASSPMANSDYSQGWCEYTALGFDFEFQSKPGRGVPERLGAQNPGNGLWGLPPTSGGHYWEPFLEIERRMGWPSPAGNGRWVLFEVPPSPAFYVEGADGAAVAGATVQLYRAAPGRDVEPGVWRFASPPSVTGVTDASGIVRFTAYDALADADVAPDRRPLAALARVTLGEKSVWRVVDINHLNNAYRRDPESPPPIPIDTDLGGRVVRFAVPASATPSSSVTVAPTVTPSPSVTVAPTLATATPTGLPGRGTVVLPRLDKNVALQRR